MRRTLAAALVLLCAWTGIAQAQTLRVWIPPPFAPAPGRHRVPHPAHAEYRHAALAERKREPAAVSGQAHP
jgi:hypothetical protein